MILAERCISERGDAWLHGGWALDSGITEAGVLNDSFIVLGCFLCQVA